MGLGKSCGTTDEGKQVEVEHLVQRGRELQSRTIYDSFAKAVIKGIGCLGGALRVPSGRGQKLKEG